jgi:hypothetical protein
MLNNSNGHGKPTDWWCVGILIYECIFATTPFAVRTALQLAHSHSLCMFTLAHFILSAVADRHVTTPRLTNRFSGMLVGA